MQNIEISVVVPVFKEEKTIAPFLDRIVPVLKKINHPYEIIFSLDPSPDNTEEVIIREISGNKSIKLLTFSRRFGQPAATMAGIREASGNYIVLIDVDLQDPPELIFEMYEKSLKGFDVVYARRVSRQGETFIKKIIAKYGAALINKFSDVEIPRNVGEFRMMNRKVVNELLSLRESHGFIRGLVAYVGFRQGAVDFSRDARILDDGKYNRFTGSIKIGLNGLFGFSSKPLQLMSLAGFFISVCSFLFGALYLTLKYLDITIVAPGVATIVFFISFFSGIQLFSLGVMGEYVARIYDEVKQRPGYIIDKKINF